MVSFDLKLHLQSFVRVSQLRLDSLPASWVMLDTGSLGREALLSDGDCGDGMRPHGLTSFVLISAYQMVSFVLLGEHTGTAHVLSVMVALLQV